MQLEHAFDVPLSVPATWDLLGRIDEIAGCLPGARASKAEDGTFEGSVRTRLGPLDMTFKGVVEIIERDVSARRMVMRSKGSEAKGQGSASATTVAVLTEMNGGSHVALDTELVISGRVAQMGRGMLVEVSNDLLERFVMNLKRDFGIVEAASAGAADPAEGAAPLISPVPATGPTVAGGSGTTVVSEDAVDFGNLFWRMLWRRIRQFLSFGHS
jgi:carbon monoxide dehydrogenase subunit G